MTKFILLIVTAVICTAYSCRSIKPRDLEPTINTDIGIPALYLEADIHNIHKAVNTEGAVQKSYAKLLTVTPNIISIDRNIDSLSIKEDIEKDILKAFTTDVRKNIIVNNDKKQGYILLQFKYFSTNNSSFLLPYFSALGTLCLIGFPFTYIKTELEIKLTISDKKDNIINFYTGDGKGTAFVAMYWGYGNDVYRKSTIIAFKNAMENIRQQISNDKQMLTERLSQQ
jgi:hypothetical protein